MPCTTWDNSNLAPFQEDVSQAAVQERMRERRGGQCRCIHGYVQLEEEEGKKNEDGNKLELGTNDTNLAHNHLSEEKGTETARKQLSYVWTGG